MSLKGWSSVCCEHVNGSDLGQPGAGWVDVPTIDAVRKVAREEAIKVLRPDAMKPKTSFAQSHHPIFHMGYLFIAHGFRVGIFEWVDDSMEGPGYLYRDSFPFLHRVLNLESFPIGLNVVTESNHPGCSEVYRICGGPTLVTFYQVKA